MGDRDRSSSKIREGDTVEAKCAGWTKYYKGEVTRVNSDDTFDIKFEDGERKRGVEKQCVMLHGIRIHVQWVGLCKRFGNQKVMVQM